MVAGRDRDVVDYPALLQFCTHLKKVKKTEILRVMQILKSKRNCEMKKAKKREVGAKLQKCQISPKRYCCLQKQ